MRKSVFIAAVVLCLTSLAAAQDPGYYCIYGNRDGSTIDVYINSFLDLKIWAVTPPDGDCIGGIQNPLASDNSYIAERFAGGVFPPLENWDANFTPPDTESQPGYTSMTLFASGSSGPPPSIPLCTDGDTICIAYFNMRTANDSSLIGQTVCPFPPWGSYLTLWINISGTYTYIPDVTFSCLYFVDYLAGDANGSGDVSGADVTYMVNYCKGFGPPPDPIFAGDANGDCLANGMDVVYLIVYFRGGPAPFLGNCHNNPFRPPEITK